jgi:glycine/D-amino acid oxidase-like deaminating enzyme
MVAPLLGLYQPQGGLLASERCIVAHVSAALRRDAAVHGREPVRRFCNIVGEILADLAEHGTTRHDIGLFRADRFGERPAGVNRVRRGRR